MPDIDGKLQQDEYYKGYMQKLHSYGQGFVDANPFEGKKKRVSKQRDYSIDFQAVHENDGTDFAQKQAMASSGP